MSDYVTGVCDVCREGHVFTSPDSRDKWLTQHRAVDVLPEPKDRYSTDREAAGF